MRNTLAGAAALVAAALPFNAEAQRLSLPAGIVALQYDGDVPVVSTRGMQIAQIEIDNLAEFRTYLQKKRTRQLTAADAQTQMRVNYYLSANSGLDKNADMFVVYAPDLASPAVRESGPQKCAAFFNVNFDYTTNRDETAAAVNLSTAGAMPDALARYGCIVVHNQRKVKAGQIPVLNKP
jgi:hypothetical protein